MYRKGGCGMSSNMDQGLTNFDLVKLAKYLKINNFRGVFCRDTLPKVPHEKESGIVNMNTAQEPGSHWTGYYKDGSKRIYFDSFGQITPLELQKYLKTKEELENDASVIQRNTDIVQKPGSSICGQLCLYVLDKLSKGAEFQTVIDSLKWYPSLEQEESEDRQDRLDHLEHLEK